MMLFTSDADHSVTPASNRTLGSEVKKMDEDKIAAGLLTVAYFIHLPHTPNPNAEKKDFIDCYREFLRLLKQGKGKASVTVL